jgi:hypothetical protein
MQASADVLEAALLHSRNQDEYVADLAIAWRSFQHIRSKQPDVALLKFLTEARAVRLLPANINNLKFCQKATAAFPVLKSGIHSPPAQQLLEILVKDIPFELPGMKCSPPPHQKKKIPSRAFFPALLLHLVPSPATSAAFMSGMRAIMARNGRDKHLPPESFFSSFQKQTPLDPNRSPIQPVTFNGHTFMMDVSGRDRIERTTADDEKACFKM